MTDSEIKAGIEAILFASGAPVPLSRLASALEINEKKALESAQQLMEDYKSEQRGIQVIRLEQSFQMCNKKQYGEYIRRAMDLRRNTPLSQAALEVLAVIAYNQPVTKAFVEQVRGVDCSGVIGSLTTKGLVEEKGRLELPGRPLLYGTTENFLRCFQIESLDELPPIPEKQEDKAEETEAPEESDDGEKE
ncbi:MAG: SMC-Scp complex subunit ScpB [Acutalibacteraceae bacterium]